MKKLFAPILVLTLIVGFGALALGDTTEATGSQTFTVDVSSAFSVDAPGTVTLDVGPNTTDSETPTDGLGYSYNDTAASSITVDVSDTDFHTMTLTVTASNMTGTGTGESFTISSGTSGATLISGLEDNPDSYSADVKFEGGTTDWTESADTYSDTLTLTYKMVS